MSRSGRLSPSETDVRSARSPASRISLPASSRPSVARQEEMELSLAMATLTDDKLIAACQSNEVLHNFCEESDILAERTASIAASRKSFSQVDDQEIGDWTINQIVAFFASLDDDHSMKFLTNPIAHAVVMSNPLAAIRARKLEEATRSPLQSGQSSTASLRSGQPLASSLRSGQPSTSPLRSARSPQALSRQPVSGRSPVRSVPGSRVGSARSANPPRVSLEELKLWGDVKTDASSLASYSAADVAALSETDPHVAKVIATPEYKSLRASRRSVDSLGPTPELCAKCQGYFAPDARVSPYASAGSVDMPPRSLALADEPEMYTDAPLSGAAGVLGTAAVVGGAGVLTGGISTPPGSVRATRSPLRTATPAVRSATSVGSVRSNASRQDRVRINGSVRDEAQNSAPASGWRDRDVPASGNRSVTWSQ